MRHANDRHPAVLVVEDEPLIRLDICLALSDAGFAVIETGTAEEALEILRTRRGVGVVFTDVELPGITGIVLRDKIVQNWPHIPVLMTSGKRDAEIAELATRVVFFPKPYDAQAVISSVREVAA